MGAGFVDFGAGGQGGVYVRPGALDGRRGVECYFAACTCVSLVLLSGVHVNIAGI